MNDYMEMVLLNLWKSIFRVNGRNGEKLVKVLFSEHTPHNILFANPIAKTFYVEFDNLT